MTGPVSVQPDPSAIGGVPKAPFVLLPDPARLFARRAARFEALAATSPMAAYLRFLGALTAVQADLAATLPRPEAVPPEQIALARQGGMPPLDRARLADAPQLSETMERLFAQAAAIDKPAAADEALRLVRDSDGAARRAMAANVLADAIPFDAVAPHLYVAAAVQVHAALCASTLSAADVAPVAAGVCPACGGVPVSSMVVGFHGAEGVRYAVCSCCATQWNEVRMKCLACGSTKGIGYREVDGAEGEATIKAEVCDECRSWVKILYQNKNPSLDPVADDVGTLGLDMLMRDTDYSPAGFNPFLVGY